MATTLWARGPVKRTKMSLSSSTRMKRKPSTLLSTRRYRQLPVKYNPQREQCFSTQAPSTTPSREEYRRIGISRACTSNPCSQSRHCALTGSMSGCDAVGKSKRVRKCGAWFSSFSKTNSTSWRTTVL
eukprot:12899043-Heterocapsa_arctica.AAC.1